MENLPPPKSKSSYYDFAMIPYALFGRVSPTALGVFAGFAKFCTHSAQGKGETFASIDTVAKLLGVERRSVMRAIRELQKAGAMRTRRQGLGKPAIRTLQMPPVRYRPEGTTSVPLPDVSTKESPRIFYNVIDMKKEVA